MYGASLAGLVGWWEMNEGTGTIVNNRSGNANHGTMHNFASPHGWVGGAISFDGVDDHMTVVHHQLGPAPTAFTVTGWIRSNLPIGPASNTFIVRTRDWVGNSYITVSLHSGYLLLGNTGVWDGVNWEVGESRVTLVNPHDWNFFALTFNEGRLQLIVNQVHGPEATLIRPIHTLWHGWVMGIPWWGGANNVWYNGLMDEFRVFNRALTAEEIAASFRQGR